MSEGGEEGDLLDIHYREFSRFVDQAEKRLRRREWNHAAALAQMAGAYAWLNHCGMFSSPRLEQLLKQLSGHVRSVEPIRSNRVDVLHVVTQVYATGGPTQAIACWIDQDRDRTHWVCTTQQGAAPLPDKIVSRVSQGELIDLTSQKGGLLERAAVLRALAQQAETVVVHSHPHDVVPTLALAGGRSEGVVTVNHADHVFWVGTSVPGIVLNMRDSGRDLTTRRRGIPANRSIVMPRPLPPRTRTMDRSTAKERLGIPTDNLLIVTAADAPKYVEVSPPSLLEALTPVFRAYPTARLLAAGPPPDGVWGNAGASTGGRIRALGRLSEVSLLQQAADIYVDSYPFSSLTSLLEAGSFGTPVVTFRGHPDACAVLGADTPGVDEHMLKPSTPDELQRTLARLMDDETLRLELGARTQQAISSTHTGAGWRTAVEHLYVLAARPVEASPTEPERRDSGPLDQMVALVQARTPFHQGVPGAVRSALPFVPAMKRLEMWRALAVDGRFLSPVLLLPPRYVAKFTMWRRACGIRRRGRPPALQTQPETTPGRRNNVHVDTHP